METQSVNRPSFSVVTPALNCGQFLERNLESVRTQNLPANEIEHWIIDGGSTDGSVALLREQKDICWISEPDNGLSHAVNKGLERSTGTWLLWLNADDELAPNALNEFLRNTQTHPEARVFCGRQKILGYDGSLESISESWDYNLNELLGTRTGISQASTFVHRSVYEKVGLLDESHRYAMDYEWIVRAMHEFKCQPIETILSVYHRRAGSIMDSGIAHQHREFLRVRRKYGLSRFSTADFVFRWYLLTDPLRQVRGLRRIVRAMKRAFGKGPDHPMPERH